MRSLYKTMMILGATAMMAWPVLAAKHQGLMLGWVALVLS